MTPDEQKAHQELNENPDENREFAKFLVQTLQQADSEVADLTTAMARWVSTSLLVINGGASVAIWQSDLDWPHRAVACLLGIVGLLLSLLSGNLAVGSAVSTRVRIAEQIGYWITVVGDGTRLQVLEAKHSNFDQEARRMALPSRVVGWLSVICFCLCIGVAVFGHQEKKASEPVIVIRETSDANGPTQSVRSVSVDAVKGPK